MSIASVDHLVDTLRRLHLLDPSQLHELPGLQARFPAPQAVARELVRRGWLTPYQVNQLFRGHGHDLLLGSYVLLEKLGEGGMGAVFKARNWKLGQVVALKLIRKERLANVDAVRRFQREIRAAAQLNHANVVHAHDADEVAGTHFFAMEYVEGTDLARLVKQHGPLPVAQACEYVRQAALGLQHAYERGLVHRDVKPHNLLLAKGGVVKVLDMGLARLGHGPDGDAASSMTESGCIMGTPDYMAPEQARNSHAADIRSDLYSLGCTLYYLLSGRVPFPHGTVTEKMLQHNMDEPTPLEQLRPDVPAGVAAVVRRLMAKRPQDRYQTPAELAAALSAAPAAPTPAAVAVPVTAVPAGDTLDRAFDFMPTDDAVPAKAEPVARPAGGRRLLVVSLGCLGVAGLALLGLAFVLLPGPRGDTAGAARLLPTAPAEQEKEITNSLGMKLVLIPPGKFLMGSPASEAARRENEGPQHEVLISKPFYMGAYEVTQGQFQKMMGRNPSNCAEGPNNPVESMTWVDAVTFCEKLSALDAEERARRVYRLPTEAEWEYACRAGTRTAYSFGDDHEKLTEYGWFAENDKGRTHPVGLLRPNPWGLYDMHGNVWELCGDFYVEDYYVRSPATDPHGPPPGPYRAIRGGARGNPWSEERSANRWPNFVADQGHPNVGFRVVCTIGPAR
jgi:formylglycine-generating enzyme required for sulfatase activity/tRNA A-37 threonylcarbamoyl transferase component Bud32